MQQKLIDWLIGWITQLDGKRCRQMCGRLWILDTQIDL